MKILFKDSTNPQVTTRSLFQMGAEACKHHVVFLKFIYHKFGEMKCTDTGCVVSIKESRTNNTLCVRK